MDLDLNARNLLLRSCSIVDFWKLPFKAFNFSRSFGFEVNAHIGW